MDSPDVRCPGKPHARLISPDVWEVKCNSKICGARPGVVVLHRFSTATGKLLETLRFSDLAMKEVNRNASRPAVAVRPA